METSLLATKLFIPPARPGLVPRPRLMERLQAALTCRLTLISAQAGYGKSTVLTQWISENKLPGGTAWFSLDEGDNDPVRFWDYFVAALRTLRHTTGEAALALLHSPQPYPTESVLTALINDLASDSIDLVVVLDDYHLIKSKPIHDGIAFLLDHLPPRMHLVIATRADPHLPLAHLRGRGQMVEIGADDLRFTVEETADLLKETQGPPLSEEDIAALNARTEGWAVGLKMAGLSMRGRKDVKTFLATFTGSHRYVMDYLTEELVKQQPEEIRDFLLKTSVLERLTGPLCDSVTGRSDSRDMLLKEESAFGGFLMPLDESRQWYRYHHLLAELLRHQLERVSGAAELTRLHQRASQWYEDHGFPDDAVCHAMAARDWERAVRLITNFGDRRHKSGEYATLLDWVKAIPEEVMRDHPSLYLLHSRALLAINDLDTAEACLRNLGPVSQNDPNLQGEIASLMARIAMSRGNSARAMELSKSAMVSLGADNLDERSRMSHLQGFILFEKGLYDEAEPLLIQGYQGALLSEDYEVAVAALNFLAVITSKRGRLRQAVSLLRQAVSLAEASPASNTARLSLSSALYEMNELEEAARQQQRVNEISPPKGNVQAYFFLAHTRLAQGNVAGAILAADKSDQLVKDLGLARYGRARHAAYRVLLAIRQGDQDATAHWRNQLSEYADSLPFWLSHVPYRALIACGERATAAEQLQTFCRRNANADVWGILLKIRVCQALAAATPAEALSFLAEALTIGQPEGYIRSFVDESRPLTPLLRKALSQGITPEYTRRLLNIIEDEERRRHAPSDLVASLPSGALSNRELEILRLVAAGLSNKQIADRLIIALGTAKTHVHRIFEKLNAKDRLQAVTRARELKLV